MIEPNTYSTPLPWFDSPCSALILSQIPGACPSHEHSSQSRVSILLPNTASNYSKTRDTGASQCVWKVSVKLDLGERDHEQKGRKANYRETDWISISMYPGFSHAHAHMYRKTHTHMFRNIQSHIRTFSMGKPPRCRP